jgi:hypothetical protein
MISFDSQFQRYACGNKSANSILKIPKSAQQFQNKAESKNAIKQNNKGILAGECRENEQDKPP